MLFLSLIIRGCDDIYSDKLALANVVCCCISLIIRGRDDIYSDKLANLQVNRSCPIYIGLSRLNTARGSCTGFVTAGPAKVKAYKSILFTEGFPEVEIKNT